MITSTKSSKRLVTVKMKKGSTPNYLRNITMICMLILLSTAKVMGQYNMTSGTITIPAATSITFYDDKGPGVTYSQNQNVTETFTADNGYPMLITFTQFALQSNSNNDYLEIYDGPSTTSTLIGTYRRNNIPPSFTTTGSSVTFRFISNNSSNRDGDGWTANIRTLTEDSPVSTCSGTFTDKQGAASNYARDQYYAVSYQSDNGKTLQIAFTDFNLGSGDALEIIRGDLATGTIIGTYSGNGTPGNIYSLPGGMITFVFSSDNTATTGRGWSANLSCIDVKTYYSYTSGSWNDPAAWTLESSGTIYNNPGNNYPGQTSSLDLAVIKNGDVIAVNNNNNIISALEIEDGSILDVGGATGQNYGTISGKGRLRSTSGTLPSGTYTQFTSSDGGTIELYGNITGSPELSWDTFNNLEIKGNTNQSVYAVLNTQINGNLLVESGGFYINHNGTTNLSMTVEGNVTVYSGATFSLGGGNAYHNLFVNGNFENEGTVTFTNSTIPASYTSNPAESVTLTFNNTTSNQSFACNGPTILDKLVVDKGTDDTYMLDLNANTSANFSLRGRNDQDVTNPDSPGNVINNKALEVLAGTLRLGSNITIPRLLTSTTITPYYAIDQDATIIVDGATVGVTEQNNTSCIIAYGKLKITGSSTFSSSGRQGIILREYGVFEIDGGTVNTTAFRTSSRLELGTHRGTFIMTDGTLNINGDNYANTHPAFALPFGDNTFQMSGGTINITASTYSTNGGGANYYSWLVSANSQNISVTGGDINIYATTRRAYINSTAPFYNLNLIGATGYNISLESIAEQVDGGNVVVPAAPLRELVVLKNLTIRSNTTFVTNDQNVTVASNFSIDPSGTYTPGVNTTTFNGFDGQLFTNAGTITSGLYNMTLANASTLDITNNLTVRGVLSIGTGTTLRDMGQTVTALSDITNNGTHESQPGGSIVLQGTTDQNITGNGLGKFGNLSLNKTSGNTILNASIGVTGDLRLANTSALMNIGSNQLSLSATSNIYDALTGTTSSSFSTTKMIQTGGAQSDKGIEKAFSAIGTFTFPLGSAGKYTPAKVEMYSAPTVWGSLSVNPVNMANPLATNANTLKYYWNVKRQDMDGFASGDLKMKFYYNQADVTGTESLYVPAIYYPVIWTYFTADKVADATNEILFDSITDPRGQFTAGEPGSFGTVEAFYSRQTGNWSDYSGGYTSWTTDTLTNAPATSLPGVNSPVIIRSGHTITIPSGENNKLVGSLTLQSNAVLDITTTTGHFFGLIQESTITGTGTIRISSATATAQFPGGDFGDFLGDNGGTIEYYTTGAQDFTMPSGGKTTTTLLNEGFEGSFPPAGWTTLDNDGGGTSWGGSTLAHSGSASALHSYYTWTNQNGFLMSPSLNFSDNGSYTLTFWRYCGYPTDYQYQGVWVSTTNNSAGSFVPVKELGQGTANWQQVTVDLSAYAGNSTVYIAFVYQGTNADNMYIDDVTVTKTTGNSSYHHLVVNPAAGRTITFPDINVNISGNLTVKGAGITSTTGSASTAITVTDSTSIKETGTFRFENERVQSFIAKGSLTIDNGASMVVNTGGSGTQDHKLSLYGNTVNNGTLNLNPGNNRYADLYFLGTKNQTFSGTGAITSLYRVYVNKGTTQTPMVDVTSDKFDLSTAITQALYINNGTIRFTGNSLNLALTTTDPFTIPQTGCLSVNGSSVTVGSAASDAADIYLGGKLEVVAGTMNVGAAANNTNNDIEYATAGTPQVVVGGTGRLNVNGQIRRSTTIATGSLTYQQSGGDVYIYGKNRDANQKKRALLEILNIGSHFEMTGGNLNLVQGVSSTEAANTFGELYLNPESYNITGGTITTGTTETAAATNYFNLYLACPVWNLTVDGTTNAKNAVLRTFAATINGNLLINGPTASTFNTSGLNVDIGGNLENTSTYPNIPGAYQYGNTNQVTRFFGNNSAQHVTSNGIAPTRFGKLSIDNPQTNGTVTLSGSTNFMVIGDIIINKGTLVTDNQYVTLQGNLINYASHSSIGSNGFIIFLQSTSITGRDGSSVGKIYIYSNKTVTSNISFQIKDYLRLGSTSKLNIGNKLLSFGPNATVIGANSTAYILTNGALSDQGVCKEYNTAGSFTFPIGVGTDGGKYTPVTMNVTNTGGTAGTITIKPVDAPHPMRTNSIDDELQYFWSVSSTGFGATPTVSQTYAYNDADILGTESTYVNARIYNNVWTSQTEAIDYANNLIKFTNVSFIDGDYTAGAVSNWGTVHSFYSRNSGNWETAGSWYIDSPTGPTVAGTAPNGNPVYIQAGHTITTNQNGAYAGSVNIASSATLDLGTKLNHNLGVITGAGTIHIDATGAGSFVFPGGDPSGFMNTTGSTVHYSGAGTMPASITTYQNLTFSVNGYKTIPAVDILVKGNLSILGGNLNNSDNNRTITLQGDWTDNVVSGFIPGTGKVSFTGGNNQTITATGGENFYNFEVNKTGNTVTLANSATINRMFTLTSGVVNTSATNLLTMAWDDPNALSGGNSNAYIDGPMRKLIRNSSTFRFPLGNASRYGSFYISGTQTSGNQYWTAEYYNAPPANQTNLAAPLQLVSNNEYWTLTGVSGAKANVQLRWDSQSQIIPATAVGRQKLRVAEYLTSLWTKVGQTVVDGGISSGTVSTSTPITCSGSEDQFTIGIEETASAQITGTDASVCDDGTIMPVTISLSGDAPLSVVYSINGTTSRTITNINGTSYTLNLTYADLFAIGGIGDYTITLLHVYDKNGIEGVILPSQAVLTLKATPNPIVSGPNSVMTSSTTAYSVANNAGSTYSWSISGLGTLTATTTPSVSVTWGATAGSATLQCTETNSTSGCSTTTSYLVSVRDWPVIVGNFNVCANATETYSSKQVTGHTYTWNVVGGTILSGSGTYQITVQWGTEASGSIELTQGSSTDGYNTISEIITINPSPTASISADNASICQNDPAVLNLGRSNAGTIYTFYLTLPDATEVMLDQTAAPTNPFKYTTANLPWIGPGVTTPYTYKLKIVDNTTGCYSAEVQTTVNVYVTPQTGPEYHISNTFGY